MCWTTDDEMFNKQNWIFLSKKKNAACAHARERVDGTNGPWHERTQSQEKEREKKTHLIKHGFAFLQQPKDEFKWMHLSFVSQSIVVRQWNRCIKLLSSLFCKTMMMMMQHAPLSSRLRRFTSLIIHCTWTNRDDEDKFSSFDHCSDRWHSFSFHLSLGFMVSCFLTLMSIEIRLYIEQCKRKREIARRAQLLLRMLIDRKVNVQVVNSTSRRLFSPLCWLRLNEWWSKRACRYTYIWFE